MSEYLSLNSIIIGSIIGVSIYYIVRKLFSSSKQITPNPKNQSRNIVIEEKKGLYLNDMEFINSIANNNNNNAEELPVYLNRERQQSTLTDIVTLSHDTRLFR